MCTSRNLVLLILSTAARLTISYQNLFNFLHIQEEIVFFTSDQMAHLVLGVGFMIVSIGLSQSSHLHT